ncbi:MAG TPA: hypothetical protein PK179_13090 [Spirochaetales bacterium]|nr:hypothetical protein [Spirochaetales bacterium]
MATMMRMGRPAVRAATLACAMALAAAPLLASPFTSSDDDAPPLPTVRAPGSQGPMVETQRGLRERAAESIRLFAEEPSGRALAGLLAAAFVYGVLHAMGPGHRKTIVFSLFIGKKAAPWEPLAAGFMAAGVHAGVGMAIVGVLSLAYGAIAGLGDAERISAYLDASTFGVLILAALVLAALKLRAMASGKGHGSEPSGRRRGLYGIVFVSSLIPCPGATMILLFALYAGLPWIGAAAVLAMSVGMGVVISAAGYLAYAGRVGLFGSLKAREKTIGLVSDLLELVSYLLVLGFSLYMAWPTITALPEVLGL